MQPGDHLQMLFQGGGEDFDIVIEKEEVFATGETDGGITGSALPRKILVDDLEW